MSNYAKIKDIIGSDKNEDDKQRVEQIIQYLRDNSLLTQKELDELHGPGQNNKFKISIVLKILRENIEPLKKIDISDKNLKSLVEIVNEELELISKFDDLQTFSEIFSMNRIDYGSINNIIKLHSNMSYSYIAETSNKDYFLRYQAPFGLKYIIKKNQKELVFHNLLVENIYMEIFGKDFVTNTISPSFEEAKKRRKLDDSLDYLDILNERSIIQPSYTPEFIMLNEVRDWNLVGKVFGEVVAKIHSETIGLNKSPKGLVKTYFNELRDKTIEEYILWLENECWAKKRFDATSEKKEAEKYLNEITQSLQKWDICVEQSKKFWQEGAVLVFPDTRPNNTFYNKEKGVRIFDFDYGAFLDPSYHCSQAMFHCVKDATAKGIANAETLTNLVSNFLEKYLKNISSPQHSYLKSRWFIENIINYFVYSTISRYLQEFTSNQTSSEKMEAIHKTTNNLIKMMK